MKIEQQEQIRAFLAKMFGPDEGAARFARQEKTLTALLGKQADTSASRQKTRTQRILPCIALYQSLQAGGLSQAGAYSCTRTYMLENVAAKQHVSTAKMERVPGFYVLYSAIFRKVMRGSELWESTQSHTSNSFDVTIRKCLWHTTCTENGCPELCQLFCDVDHITYGGLKKIGFTRTKTLGHGDDCCDFHFFRK